MAPTRTGIRLCSCAASEVGRHLGEAVKGAADVTVVKVPGQADLMFCREQGCLSVQELHKLMKQFALLTKSTVVTPPSSPHARFDIVDWLPLDPNPGFANRFF